MRKHFKSIAAAFMAVMMLMSLFCTPAMAVDQNSDANDTAYPISVPVDVAEKYAPMVANNPALLNYEALIGQFHSSATYSGSQVKVGTPIWIDGSANLLKHYITGPSSWVIIRLVHQTSGATRSFTGVSNGGWYQDNVSAMQSGYWNVYIINAGARGEYNVTINAYFAS